MMGGRTSETGRGALTGGAVEVRVGCPVSGRIPDMVWLCLKTLSEIGLLRQPSPF
jgi:hypothetical protein